ncbi:MAG: hypothetical protein BJ554DRAFT_7705, partial [Olpidium bornovanus]
MAARSLSVATAEAVPLLAAPSGALFCFLFSPARPASAKRCVVNGVALTSAPVQTVGGARRAAAAASEGASSQVMVVTQLACGASWKPKDGAVLCLAVRALSRAGDGTNGGCAAGARRRRRQARGGAEGGVPARGGAEVRGCAGVRGGAEGMSVARRRRRCAAAQTLRGGAEMAVARRRRDGGCAAAQTLRGGGRAAAGASARRRRRRARERRLLRLRERKEERGDGCALRERRERLFRSVHGQGAVRVLATTMYRDIVLRGQVLHEMDPQVTACPTSIRMDNDSAAELASNAKATRRVAEGTIEIRRVMSAENPADIFTKPLDRIKFTKFREMLVVRFDQAQTSRQYRDLAVVRLPRVCVCVCVCVSVRVRVCIPHGQCARHRVLPAFVRKGQARFPRLPGRRRNVRPGKSRLRSTWTGRGESWPGQDERTPPLLLVFCLILPRFVRLPCVVPKTANTTGGQHPSDEVTDLFVAVHAVFG